MKIYVHNLNHSLAIPVPKPEHSGQTVMCPGSLSRQPISIRDIDYEA